MFQAQQQALETQKEQLNLRGAYTLELLFSYHGNSDFPSENKVYKLLIPTYAQKGCMEI